MQPRRSWKDIPRRVEQRKNVIIYVILADGNCSPVSIFMAPTRAAQDAKQENVGRECVKNPSACTKVEEAFRTKSGDYYRYKNHVPQYLDKK